MKISLNQPNGFSSHFSADTYKYIDAKSESIKFVILDIEHRRNQFNPYVNNGGTVVAIAGPDFVVVGGDSRLSEGYSIVTRGETKLVELTTKTVLATSGMYADFCELTMVHSKICRFLKPSCKYTTLKLKDCHQLNPLLIFFRKLYMGEDFSLITRLTWWLDWIKMERGLSMDMMLLEVMEAIRL